MEKNGQDTAVEKVGTADDGAGLGIRDVGTAVGRPLGPDGLIVGRLVGGEAPFRS